MELQYKPDFDKAMERFEAWWHCQIIDRPPVTIYVEPERKAKWPAKHHAKPRDRWFDVEYKLDCMDAAVQDGVFLGETFPRLHTDLGPEVCATTFGCQMEFGEHTTWSIPCVKSCREILKLRPSLDNVYWNALRQQVDGGIQRGAGKWITALPDFHTDGDLVAALRDPEAMCLDLMDDPEGVRAACDYVNDSAYAMMYDDLWNRIKAAGQPATTWAPFLHAGRAYVTSCDFICMISTPMFRQAILPSIQMEMRFLERNIFHLDGPGALRHLDDLLAQPELNGLQWIYGAGNGPGRKWAKVQQRAQAAGKCIQLVCEDLDDAKALAADLRPEGVWFCPGGSYTRQAAEEFLDWTARWAAGKRA